MFEDDETLSVLLVVAVVEWASVSHAPSENEHEQRE